jgi:hypothetical protein
MRILVRFVFCAVIILTAGLSHAADDFEFWPGNTVKIKLNNKVSINFLEEFRMKNDMSNFYTYVLYAGSNIKINRYIDTAIWYKLVESEKDKNWRSSHRYDVDLILKYDLGNYRLSNRSRIERNITGDSWLYRDRIKIAKEFEVFEYKYTPYLSNEFFIDLNPDEGYHENRATIGISADFFLKTKLTLYYMSRAKEKDDDWTNANVLGGFIGMVF